LSSLRSDTACRSRAFCRSSVLPPPRDRDSLPADRSIDVRFREYMTDQMGTEERIYEMADLDMTDEARPSLQAYLDSHSRDRHGQLEYDLKSDFGLEPDDLRKRFAFYMDRFGITADLK